MDRLSGLDASFLYLETPQQMLHVVALLELDPSTIPGGYDFERFKSELARRVRTMPGFRRKLYDTAWNLDHPVWVDDPDFDVDLHVHRVAVPAPGEREQLAELAAHIASQPMDRSRPLWEFWTVESLANGNIAIVGKMHHATVDGVTGANMMSQLCGLTPELDTPPEPEPGPAARVNDLDLAVGGLRAFAARPVKLVQVLADTVPLIPDWVFRARRGAAMPAPFTAPRCSFNGTVTGHRSIAYTQLDMAIVKQVKNAFGAKVNDVVLTLVSGALRSYLTGRDELPESSLVASIPVSVHGKSDRPGTNRVTGMFMQLRTDISDPVQRLRTIAADNSVAKEHQDAISASLLQDWAQFAAPATFGLAVRLYANLRLADRHPVIHNLVVSNVPGPPVPLYFLGAQVKAMAPLGPVFHGAGLTMTAMSLENKLNVGVIACKELAPDLWSLVDAFPAALDELARAAAEQST